jgi:hydrogenase maturation protease
VKACIVGIGEPLAGDDAAGIRVIERLRGGPRLPSIELFALRDPSDLAELLPGRERALIIDALLDPAAVGRVELHEVEPGIPIARRPAPALSSHGLDALTAIELGRVLAAGQRFPVVSLLTIAIAYPDALGGGLSARVAGAVQEAAGRARTWAVEATHA